jgi:hypothetical protein
LQAAGSKEKLGAERRNPTILRKSKTFDISLKFLFQKEFIFATYFKFQIAYKQIFNVICSIFQTNLRKSNKFCTFLELDVCIYLMSAVGIKMEVEDGASATASELVRKLETFLNLFSLNIKKNNFIDDYHIDLLNPIIFLDMTFFYLKHI